MEQIENKRNYIIDIMKGIGILSMVIGHSSSPITGFIYIFHMSLFFILAGFCYKDKYSKDYKNFFLFILKKIKSLWFPFFLWTSISLLLNNTFIDINIYTNNLTVNEVYKNINFSIHQYLTTSELKSLILKALVFKTGTDMTGAFWFIAALFMLSIFFCFIDFLISIFSNNKKSNYIIHGILSVIFLALGYLLSSNHISLPYQYEKVLSYYCLFYIGYIIKEFNLLNKNYSLTIHELIFIISFLILLIMRYCPVLGPVELNINFYRNPLYLILTSIIGFCFCYEIANFISHLDIIKKFFIILGQNTMSILIFHFLSFKVVSIIGILINSDPLIFLAAYPVLYVSEGMWIIYSIVGIILPLLLSLCYKLIRKKVLSLMTYIISHKFKKNLNNNIIYK